MSEESSAPIPPSDPQRRVVVGVDGSERSILALRRAREAAESMNTQLDVVTSWSYPIVMTAYELVFSPTFEEIAHSEQAKAIEKVFGQDRPSWLNPLVIEGNAAQRLVELSEGAELVVLGSRGHGGFKGLLLGSVSSEVASRAKSDVLIVREPASDD